MQNQIKRKKSQLFYMDVLKPITDEFFQSLEGFNKDVPDSTQRLMNHLKKLMSALSMIRLWVARTKL